jgi:hypothetical protein
MNPVVIGEFNFRLPVQEQYPFMIILVIPETVRRGMTVGDDALNLHGSLSEQFGEHFLGQIIRQEIKQVHVRTVSAGH